MGIWKTIKAAFAPGTSTPPDARRLSAIDELALSASLRALPVGERGWITLSEARALFSPMDDRYAFGEMDEVGKMSLAAFAAESDHRSAFDLAYAIRSLVLNDAQQNPATGRGLWRGCHGARVVAGFPAPVYGLGHMVRGRRGNTPRPITRSDLSSRE